MPEPDISVVRGRSRDYVEQPKAGDVSMVVEVADKGRLAYDQGEKLGAYAEGGIPVYWIVNLVDRQVEVYTDPSPAGYRSRADFKPGEARPASSSTARPSAQVAVDDMLP